MNTLSNLQAQVAEQGFSAIRDIYSDEEIDSIVELIEQAETSRPTFRKTTELFAIRQFLKEVPSVLPLIFTSKLTDIINSLFGGNCFIVKSIYFDKPATSNWFVSYHQDLTISVDRKVAVDGFGPWSVKQDQFAVQPPLSILENNFTIRIHLDDTNENNGALRIIPGSHTKGIYRPENIDWDTETETICKVPKGGIMIMRPLLLHSSARTTNEKQRRVIHVEFSKQQLPEPLQWSEYAPIPLINTKNQATSI